MFVNAHQVVCAANSAVEKVDGSSFGVIQLVLAALNN